MPPVRIMLHTVGSFCTIAAPVHLRFLEILGGSRTTWTRPVSAPDSIFSGFKMKQPVRVLSTSKRVVYDDNNDDDDDDDGDDDGVRGDRKPKLRWIEIRSEVTEEQKEVLDRISRKVSKRCLAVLKQVICFSPERWSLEEILANWSKIMKPRRTDWLLVLKKLHELDHPLYFAVAELALIEESFEPNIRDYTKIIHGYGKANRLQDAENMMTVMNNRGFVCDQISLTVLIDMYSKAGNLKRAEETFEIIKLLGEPLDNRTYGAMIMAYIRAEMLEEGENLLQEMDVQEIRAGSEIYKALLRAYSMRGDAEGAQRVFNALQIASIIPDVKICGLLINAYGLAGQSHMARIAFENMRRAGLEPNDKCVALVLAAYKNENKLNEALSFLIKLEKEGVIVGKEASETLAGWFGELGVAREVLSSFSDNMPSRKVVHRQAPSMA